MNDYYAPVKQKEVSRKKSKAGEGAFLFNKILPVWLFTAFLILTFFPYPSYSKGKKKSVEEEEKQLKFWHSIGTYNKDILGTLIDSYNERNKQNPVNSVFQGNEEDLYLKLLSQENLPDIVQIPIQFLNPLKEKKYIIALDPFISHKLKDDISLKFWDSVSMQNKIYGMPFFYSLNILFVNQHILRISGARHEGEPKTWEDIGSVIMKIKQNTDEKLSIFIPMETITQFISFTESYTGTSVFQDQSLVINTEEVISAMDFLQSAVYQEKVMPSKMTIDEGTQMFLSGNLGIMLGSSSMLVYTESNLPYDLNVWHLPSWEKIKPTVNGTCLAIIKSNTKREREAFNFVEYLVDYDSAIKWHTHTGNPAIRSSVKESLDLLIFYEESPNYMASVIELEKGKIFNPSFDYININGIIKNALEEIMVNGEDPEKILNEAQSELDKYQGM